MQRKMWWRKAIVYQIYPLSFMDSNGDGKGDLEGIISKLDYLNDGTEDSLGVDAIWLSPIYKSPMKDFGYDISNYRDIAPDFGNLEIFDKFVEEAHRRNIKVIMDFVANHTSSEHPWFKESRSSKDNPKRDWYMWRDPKPDGSPPNNWISVFNGSAWTKDEATGQYYLHQFLTDQPDLNWRNQEVIEEMNKVLEFWLHRGVDGFRTDAIYELIEDEEFRDDPPNPNYVPGRDNSYDSVLHIYSRGRPELFEKTNNFCKLLEEHQGTFMVSEAYLDIPQMMKMYHACDNRLHAPFNFNLMNMPWRAQDYKKFIDDFEKKINEDAEGDWPNYVFGNHDRSRLASRIGKERTHVAAMLLLTLRGMPFIYYGEEIGMEDKKIEATKICDPWEVSCPGLGLGRDPERTPMQWTGDQNAGFTTGMPWLPIGDNYETHNVETESRDSSSTLMLYKRLIHLRKKSHALIEGVYQSINQHNEKIFAYTRESEKEKFLIVLNFTSEEQATSFDIGKATMLISTYLDQKEGGEVEMNTFILRPNEGVLLRIEKNERVAT
ncbi:MAG: alpha-amylase [Candidatus Harrisonbacteria bacterium CG10_big_fil_rev_8_21_14_0_10_42_17]|uniref:Alpha-amylase n=1 Tax=Candidatus Harrisonbacteria bacterium CG10_big_fil_rev_8_21_14_0_10_42_17 TaxID=1974584 RepID=A0A2M6WHH1_9BACT|nr:MAG: alpha-amylase [Candidatus Harrisonbacteria bacterium CG10_big_fil_rev_8_21_14_0_10_42_17]